ncbi:polysaccharide biosynthesis/export family protein [Putridiphycobacter roseus]|nr:polysaccharide biosynthesis/export family protein [Putridiphycobacter roseus]
MFRINKINIFYVFLIVVLVQSCGINSDLMLKTPKDYVFADLDSLANKNFNNEYKIEVNDIIQFKFYTNKGIRVLDVSAGTSDSKTGNANNQLTATNGIFYVINADSLVKLPYLNMVNLVGKTIREAEYFLQDNYKAYYVDPFVQISITNKRIFVFPGSGGEAKVVNLTNNNTTLMEAIALSGGLSQRGRAKKIKLIRDIDGERLVYLIDLSTVEGLKYVDLIVQNGDYIYVEPVPELGKEILAQIAPVVSILSSLLIVISVVQVLK